MDAHAALSSHRVAEHRDFALRLARHLLHDDDAAEDVAQDTLLAALESPPRHEGVRAWIARVVSHRATDRRRGEARRDRREAAAAKPEATEVPLASPTEALETQHAVVRAVLALPEPYRSVVVATYYEGLEPRAIAARSGVPAGTVRSQLFRAHALLRVELAREHGEGEPVSRRRLAAFVAASPTSLAPHAGDPGTNEAARSPSTTTSTTPATHAWYAVAGVTAFLVAGTVWVVTRPDEAAPQVALEPAVRSTSFASTASLPAGDARAPVATPNAGEPTSPTFAEIDALDPAGLLARARTLRAALLARRLRVDPDDLHRRLAERDDAGVVKLIDRSHVNEAWNHPGARGSGAFYSFSERVHDYDRRPQILFEDGFLVAHPTGTEAWILDAGAVDPFAIAANPRQSPFPRDPVLSLTWSTMTGPLFASMQGDRDWDMLTTERQSQFEQALARREIGDADVARAPTPADLQRARPVVGHTYLLRSVEHGQFDVAVLVQVARVEDGACTIRWQRLAGLPPDRPLHASVEDERRAEVGAVPESWTTKRDAELAAELERVLARADALVVARISPEIEARYGALRGGTGLARMLPYGSPWGELTRDPFTGHSHVSFAHGALEARTHDLRVGPSRMQGSMPRLECAGREGRVVDLGTVALENVTAATLSGADPDGLAFVRDFDFGANALAIATATATERGQAPPEGPLAPNHEAWIDACRVFRRHLWDVFGVNDPTAQVGHTYLVRSVTPGESDVLAAFTVADADAYGLVIAWRVLRDGPPTPR